MFKPLANNVLVKETKAKESPGGIILPDRVKETTGFADVIAAGPGIKDEPMTVKVGDKVVFGANRPVNITLDSVNYLVLDVSQIYGVIE